MIPILATAPAPAIVEEAMRTLFQDMAIWREFKM